MIDFARITVKAGDGGNGAGSFHKIKGRRYGKADGGDGGVGGNVYFEANRDLNGLDNFRYVKDYKAGVGQIGGSHKRRGATAPDLVLKVPVGTQIKISNFKFQISNLEKTATQNSQELKYDLLEDGQKVLAARGGEGGRGNVKLRDEYGRRPRAGEKGEPGEEVNITLELKLIADVGLIGLPNAGKSTLLAELTAARPEIAPYPFTTLEPNLGVLSAYSDSKRIAYSKKNSPNANLLNAKRLIIADIPGLIEGASEGKGLGDLFLRHIERTGILVHLVDVAEAGPVSSFIPVNAQSRVKSNVEGKTLGSLRVDGSPFTAATRFSDLWHSYQTVREELKKYSKELFAKSEIVVLSKIDLIGRAAAEKLKSEFESKKKKVIMLSAETGEGIGELILLLYKHILK